MNFTTKVRLTENKNVKAIVDLTIDGSYAVHGIKIIESEKGTFVAMPSKPYKDKNDVTKYSETFHPITADARKALIDAVTAAYEAEVAKAAEADEKTK